MKDAAFLQEAHKMGFEVTPKTGEQITAQVAEAEATLANTNPHKR